MAYAFTDIAKDLEREFEEVVDVYFRATIPHVRPTSAAEETTYVSTFDTAGHVYKEELVDVETEDGDKRELLDGTFSVKRKNATFNMLMTQNHPEDWAQYIALDSIAVDILLIGADNRRVYKNVTIFANQKGDGKVELSFEKTITAITDIVDYWVEILV